MVAISAWGGWVGVGGESGLPLPHGNVAPLSPRWLPAELYWLASQCSEAAAAASDLDTCRSGGRGAGVAQGERAGPWGGAPMPHGGVGPLPLSYMWGTCSPPPTHTHTPSNLHAAPPPQLPRHPGPPASYPQTSLDPTLASTTAAPADPTHTPLHPHCSHPSGRTRVRMSPLGTPPPHHHRTHTLPLLPPTLGQDAGEDVPRDLGHRGVEALEGRLLLRRQGRQRLCQLSVHLGLGRRQLLAALGAHRGLGLCDLQRGACVCGVGGRGWGCTGGVGGVSVGAAGDVGPHARTFCVGQFRGGCLPPARPRRLASHAGPPGLQRERRRGRALPAGVPSPRRRCRCCHCCCPPALGGKPTATVQSRGQPPQPPSLPPPPACHPHNRARQLASCWQQAGGRARKLNK